jgi:hypothetical protein
MTTSDIDMILHIGVHPYSQGHAYKPLSASD